jgi:HSP20 family protein
MRELDRLQREMNRMYETGSRFRVAPSFPAVNIWTNPDGAIVTAEIPGVNTEDIDISVVGDTLTISGRREPRELDESEGYHRRERGFGSFTRSVQLPFQVEGNNVEASFKKGVLEITLPRAEADKPKKISVKTE